ncbi:MAG: hypothetical protein IE909_18120 [Campylobacterales bacterium]|nr:hypothetical protein [Campylobacterales bacterium]
MTETIEPPVRFAYDAKKEFFVYKLSKKAPLEVLATVVFASREKAISFLKFTFWRAADMAQTYRDNASYRELSPLLFDGQKNLWLIDIRFFFESFGAFIFKEFDIDRRDEIAAYVDNGMDTDKPKEHHFMRHFVSGIFEFFHGIVLMNSYETSVPKTTKMDKRPKFFSQYMVKLGGENGVDISDKNVDLLPIDELRTLVKTSVIPIKSSVAIEIFDEEILEVLLKLQSQLRQVPVTLNAFVYAKTVFKKHLRQLEFIYPFGRYDAIAKEYRHE